VYPFGRASGAGNSVAAMTLDVVSNGGSETISVAVSFEQRLELFTRIDMCGMLTENLVEIDGKIHRSFLDAKWRPYAPTHA
jgi:hypothetical protein